MRWLAFVCAVSLRAFGQSVDSERPRTLVVGPASDPTPAERADGRRSGLARMPLPSGALRIAWRRSIGPSIEHAPLVTADGKILVFTGRGDLVELDEEGTEQGRVGIGGGPLGPGAILSDGTVVTVTAAAEAVGVLGTSVRFRTRVGDRGAVVKVAPLALDDGGVVVANGVKGASPDRFGSEIAALDAAGGVRARARVPEQIVWPLVETRLGVAGVSADGCVYLWSPGTEPVRVGSFGGMLDGGVAAVDGSTLVGVVEATRLLTVDLAHGVAKVIAVAAAGMVKPGALLGPPSVSRGRTVAFEMTPTSTLIVAVASDGRTMTFPVGTFAPTVQSDGSFSPLVAPVRTATMVDASGTFAFGAPDGHVGVVTGAGMTELGEVICRRGAAPPAPSAQASTQGRQASVAARPSAGFAGIASAGPGALLVACEAGALLEVTSDVGR